MIHRKIELPTVLNLTRLFQRNTVLVKAAAGNRLRFLRTSMIHWALRTKMFINLFVYGITFSFAGFFWIWPAGTASPHKPISTKICKFTIQSKHPLLAAVSWFAKKILRQCVNHYTLYQTQLTSTTCAVDKAARVYQPIGVYMWILCISNPAIRKTMHVTIRFHLHKAQNFRNVAQHESITRS